jgi:hypothetical protein
MKRLIRRIRLYFTVAFARRMYARTKDKADKLREETHTHWHVVLDPYNDRQLQIIDRSRFRDFKRRYQDAAIRSLERKYGNKYTVTTQALTTMDDMKRGAFYSTSFTDPTDIEARRQAYIDWVVKLSEKKGGRK